MTTIRQLSLTQQHHQPLQQPALQVRPLRVDDAASLYAMHQRLSPITLFYRYLQYRTPTLAEITKICQMERNRGAGLVATLPTAGGEEVIVGMAYYVRELGTYPATAELAIVIDDQYQGQGIGRLLWQRLHQLAAAEGFQRLRVIFEPSNLRLWRLLKRSNYPYQVSHDGGVYDCLVALTPQPRPAQMQHVVAKLPMPIPDYWAANYGSILDNGYAYAEAIPCEGQGVIESAGDWLTSAELAQLNTWLSQYAPVSLAKNYLHDKGTQVMGEGDLLAVYLWAVDVRARFLGVGN